MTLRNTFCKLFFLLCGLLFMFSAEAQSLKQYIRKADGYFENKDYYNAITYYQTALKMDSSDIAVWFHFAEANRFVNNYKVAERYYNKVWTRDSKNEFPQSQYWLGMMQKSNGKYKDAEKSFDRYYRRFSRDSSNYFTTRSAIEKEACLWAQKQIAKPQKMNITHLDTTINSIHADFGATLADGEWLYYSTVRGDSFTTIYTQEIFSKIYYSIGKDTSWVIGLPVDSVFHFPNSDVSNLSINKNAGKAYCTVIPNKKNKKILPGIYMLKIMDDKLRKPERLGIEINQEEALNTQPFSYSDSLGNEILFFASDRKGGFGKLDIWYSKANKEGKFGQVINAGRFINTADDELSPFFNDSLQKLFFSSTYHIGMGGFDVFSSVWNDSLLTYGKPENIGYPVNSAANEYYYTSVFNNKKGYFSSNRIGSLSVYGETCCNDIYFFQSTDTLPPVVRDSVVLIVAEPIIPPPPPKEDIIEKIRLLVPLTLYFNNDEPDPKTTTTTTNKSYDETYLLYLTKIDKYKSEYSKGLQGAEKEKAEKEIEIFFNEQVMSGFAGLETFAALMLENLEEGRLCIVTMKGYCSPLASSDYNKNLAKRRIASLKNYFKNYANGIFVQYMSELPNPALKGKIVFEEEDVGELPSYENVSDNLQDKRNSVYSRTAATERKIQIIAISTVNQ